jgi:hypothetical protein
MKNAFVILFACALSLLVSPAVAETCARTPQEVTTSPLLKSTMQKFGGASGVFGTWDLAGLAGVFEKVSVRLAATSTAFSVQVDKDEPNDFWLCADEASPDVFKMRVQSARDPSNALILIRAREPGQTVMVASAKTNWKFMKFKRKE